MATTIQSFTIKSQDEIRDDFLRTYRNGLIKRGIPDPNVSEGTEIFVRATSFAQQAYGATVNVPIAADSLMPDTAQGDDLVRIAAIYKLALRPAGPSAGPLTLSSTISTPVAIPGGAQLIDPSGLTYSVTVGSSYSDGAGIPIASIDTGAGTNLTAGTVLRWVSPPAFVNPTAVIGSGGLTGGVDAEDYEGLRSRLLERLRTPPNADNWPSITKAAEDSSTAVQKAFVYMAANGPSTVHVAVVRSPTAANKNRDLDATVLAGTVNPYVQAQFPEYVEVVVTTVQNYPVNVAFGLSLPDSPKASPAGPGGGWIDAAPFPVLAAPGYVQVGGVTSSTVFTVGSDSPPVVGVSICWLSTRDWILRTAKVTHITVLGVGSYRITIDTPFVATDGTVINTGDYLFPAAENTAVYVKAILDGFAKMGPGEKLTGGSSLLPRALRRPLASSSWLSELKTPFRRVLSDTGEEVFDTSYIYQSAVTPPLPAAISDGPYQLVPGQIGLYPI